MSRLSEILFENFKSIDTELIFDNYVNNMYSFDCVGQPFCYFMPSKVLSEISPTDYRCMYNDWLDSCDYVYEDDEYWNKDDYNEALDILEQEESEKLEEDE